MTGIVILNYQTWELSLRCMESIRQTCVGYSYRIYLVDNASGNSMPEAVSHYLASNKQQVCFIQAATNRGYAAGNNLGVARALEDACDAILIANNDITFQKQAVQTMVQCLDLHPEVGIVGPKVVNERGEVQASRSSMKTGIKEIFQLYTAAKKVFRRKWRIYHCLDQDPDCPSYVYHVSGCCFAISQQCARAVLPFDEGTVLYDEELILADRMAKAGYRTWYEPGSVVVHRQGATTRKVQPFTYQCISQSELYYCAHYLQAKTWQLWMLYYYRRVLYLVRCICNKTLRGYWAVFQAETRKTYQKIMEQRN